MDRVFYFLLWPRNERAGHENKEGKTRGSITCRTDRANEANEGDRELEVRTATYRPGIDQSQHAKSVSHIISTFIYTLIYVYL